VVQRIFATVSCFLQTILNKAGYFNFKVGCQAIYLPKIWFENHLRPGSEPRRPERPPRAQAMGGPKKFHVYVYEYMLYMYIILYILCSAVGNAVPPCRERRGDLSTLSPNCRIGNTSLLLRLTMIWILNFWSIYLEFLIYLYTICNHVSDVSLKFYPVIYFLSQF